MGEPPAFTSAMLFPATSADTLSAKVLASARQTRAATVSNPEGAGVSSRRFRKAIEDGLSIFESTGLGVWAAGAASRMPALAETVPDYIDIVSIISDADEAGQRAAGELAARLHGRGLRAELVALDDCARAAA